MFNQEVHKKILTIHPLLMDDKTLTGVLERAYLLRSLIKEASKSGNYVFLDIYEDAKEFCTERQDKKEMDAINTFIFYLEKEARTRKTFILANEMTQWCRYLKLPLSRKRLADDWEWFVENTKTTNPEHLAGVKILVPSPKFVVNHPIYTIVN